MRGGTDGLATAVLALREARRDAPEAWSDVTKIALALALDRLGQRDESVAALGSPHATDVARELAAARVQESLENAASPHEVDALRGEALGPSDAVAARAAWKKYLEALGANAPFRAHAEARAGAPRKP